MAITLTIAFGRRALTESPFELVDVVAVVAILWHLGLSAQRLAMDVKEGDRVLFGKYAGTEVKLDDEEYLIMREDDILGVIERAAKAKGKGK